MNLNNRVAIVTGASSGIGLAVAKILTREGVSVSLAARSSDKLFVLSKELSNSLPIPTDLTKENDIHAMVKKTHEHFGRIDILVNCAGQGYDAPIENTNIITFQKIFYLDVVAPLIAMQMVIPIMRDLEEGSIINVSSGTALMYLPDMGAYSSLKRALAHLSLTAREELKRDNIIVSVAYPYITLTDFEKNTIKEGQETVWEGEEYEAPPADTAEFVAQKIVDGIKSGEAEIFMHDWMKDLH